MINLRRKGRLKQIYVARLTNLVLPLEVRRDGQLHFERGASDRLDMDCQVQFGELVHIFMNGLTHLWHADQLT